VTLLADPSTHLEITNFNSTPSTPHSTYGGKKDGFGEGKTGSIR